MLLDLQMEQLQSLNQLLENSVQERTHTLHLSQEILDNLKEGRSVSEAFNTGGMPADITALIAAGDQAGAVDQLIAITALDREWNEGAAKAQLFTIFDALKPNDPVVLNGRRKLSSMIFA